MTTDPIEQRLSRIEALLARLVELQEHEARGRMSRARALLSDVLPLLEEEAS